MYVFCKVDESDEMSKYSTTGNVYLLIRLIVYCMRSFSGKFYNREYFSRYVCIDLATALLKQLKISHIVAQGNL